MSHQFKPGDLALTLIDCEHIGSGSVVELIRFVEDGFDFVGFEADGDGWVVTCRFASKVFYATEYLMPLRGDLVPDQQKAKEAEPCA